MGNAHIWYQPEGSSRSVKIDLLDKFQTRRGPYVAYKGAYSEALGGAATTVIHAGRMSATWTRRWQRRSSDYSDTGSVLYRKLWGLQAHLKRGGSCTLVEDVTYCWAAFLSMVPPERASTLSLHSPAITNTLAAAASPLNREVYVHSDADLYLTEMQLCTAFTSYHLTMSGELKEVWESARWVLVREAGTYPAMRVPESQRSGNFLETDDNRRFTLTLPLEEDPNELEELSRTGGELADESESPVGIDLPPTDFGAVTEPGPVSVGWRW